MRKMHTQRLGARDVRRSLTARGDIRAEVAFQNDVSALLAALERKVAPWQAGSVEPTPPAAALDVEAA